MLNIIALRYFVETVRLNSFTAAAHHLGVSQSTVSKMVKNLETDLGEALIIRQKRPLLLSDVGQVLYENGLQLLQKMNDLKHQVHAVQALRQGRLRLGIPPTINLLFTDVLKIFRQRYPTIQLIISEQTGPLIEQQIAAQELDLGFSIAPTNPHLDLSSHIVTSRPICAIALKEMLPRTKGEISLSHLSKKPFLLLNDDFGLTRLVHQRFAEEQLQATIYAQSSQWDWLLSMAQAGLGIALLPDTFCSHLPADLSYKTINLPRPLNWQVSLLWNGRYLSQAAHAWLSCCAELIDGQWDWPELQNLEE